MDVVPGVSSLEVGPGAVGNVVFSDAPGLVVQMDLSGWLRAEVFLVHHELKCDEAATVEYIRGMMALVIVGSVGCCKFTAMVQCCAVWRL